jgi:hypothetical protein
LQRATQSLSVQEAGRRHKSRVYGAAEACRKAKVDAAMCACFVSAMVVHRQLVSKAEHIPLYARPAKHGTDARSPTHEMSWEGRSSPGGWACGSLLDGSRVPSRRYIDPTLRRVVVARCSCAWLKTNSPLVLSTCPRSQNFASFPYLATSFCNVSKVLNTSARTSLHRFFYFGVAPVPHILCPFCRSLYLGP